MSWSISGISYRGVIEPSTSSVTLSGTGDEVFVAFLGTEDLRDNQLNTATFNGKNMTSIGVISNGDEDNPATIAGYYYDCSALSAGNYNFFRECTTGGPDGGMEMWFVIHRDKSTSAAGSAVYRSETASGTGYQSDTIAVSYTNSLVVAAYYNRKDTTLTTGSGQTDIVTNYDSGANNLTGSSYKVSNIGTATMYWSGGESGDEWVQLTFVLSPIFTPTISKSESVEVSENIEFVIDRLLSISEEITITETLKMCEEDNVSVEETPTITENIDENIREGNDRNISIWRDSIKVTDTPDFPGPRDFHPLEVSTVSEEVTVKIVNDVNEGSKPTFKVEY